MITKDMALYSFYSGFGLPAYDENTVPTGATLPYITYQVSTDSFGNTVLLTASLWYRSTSWAAIQDKTDEISADIGRGGKLLPFDDGVIWIRRDSPFATRMGDDSDEAIRRMVLNISAEFISED